METIEKEKENLEDIVDQEEFTQELPVLPLDDLVVFPYMPPVPPFSATSRCALRKDGDRSCSERYERR